MAARLLPEVMAADLGIPAPPARLRAVVFPAFGAYVGGDITSGLLATRGDPPRPARPAVHRRRHQLRDRPRRAGLAAGHRGDVQLGVRGAAIRCGMRAADGAIEAVAISGDGDLTPTVMATPAPWDCAARAWSTR